MLKCGGERLLEVTTYVVNCMVFCGGETPEAWRRTCVKVLLKKGDPKLPEVYRPISILPIFYKLFSMVLHNRLTVYLAPQQSVGQAGFRKGFSCKDHLTTLSLLCEKAREHNIDMFVGAVDFEKAFDSVNHSTI